MGDTKEARSAGAVLSGLDQAGLVRQHDRLHAVAKLELRQHMGDVRFDRRFADEELLRDFRVGAAARDQLQHLELASGQLLEVGRKRADRGGRAPDELLDHAARDRRGQQCVAARDCPDPGDQLLGRDVLEQEAARTHSERVVDVLVHVEGGEHHDLRRGALRLEEPARRLDAVHLGHAHVHQDDIRRHALRLGQRLASVLSLPHHLDVRFRLEDHAKARAHQRLVVDDQDSETHAGTTGSLARSRNPPSGRGPASNSPP